MSTLARTTDRTGLRGWQDVALVHAARQTGARRTGRGVAAVGLGMVLVVPLGLSDGGYFGRSTTSLTVALAAAATLALVRPFEASRSPAFLSTALALGLLAAWVSLSSLWAADHAAVEIEARRCLLYGVALVAVGVIVDAWRRRGFLLALTAGIALVAALGIVIRAISGVPVDPYYGSLLAEPVGYPNAMGVLAAMGVVLSIGLGSRAGAGAARVLRGAAPLLVLVLGLTGSRGGALALGVGLVVLVSMTDRSARLPSVGMAASALALGGGAWVLTMAAGGAGLPLVIIAAGAATIGAAIPTPGRRVACALVCGVTLAGGVAVWAQPPSTTTSLRSAYWEAAFAELRERPLLGSGAGSYHLSWREHRPVEAEVRDAHSLYVETLSELGPVGLALVLVVVVVPLGVAVRRRGDPLAATAAAGFAVFAVHAGLDWDWEMPVVTLVALGCAAVLLTSAPSEARNEPS